MKQASCQAHKSKQSHGSSGLARKGKCRSGFIQVATDTSSLGPCLTHKKWQHRDKRGQLTAVRVVGCPVGDKPTSDRTEESESPELCPEAAEHKPQQTAGGDKKRSPNSLLRERGRWWHRAQRQLLPSPPSPRVQGGPQSTLPVKMSCGLRLCMCGLRPRFPGTTVELSL